ncbi:hypothetical protein ACWDA3_04795 [Nonomuraea rubra]
MKYGAVVLLVAGVLFVVAANWSGGVPESVRAAGTRYAVSVLPADPVEVWVTSGTADTVTVAAAMPVMGHALPPVGTVQADPGRFVAEERLFAMDGVWELSITVAGAQGRETISVNTVISR